VTVNSDQFENHSIDGKGDCFGYCMKGAKDSLMGEDADTKFVHGTSKLIGPHAWIETPEGYVKDWQTNASHRTANLSTAKTGTPRDEFYEMHGAEAHQTFTGGELFRMGNKAGNMGPFTPEELEAHDYGRI